MIEKCIRKYKIKFKKFKFDHITRLYTHNFFINGFYTDIADTKNKNAEFLNRNSFTLLFATY